MSVTDVPLAAPPGAPATILRGSLADLGVGDVLAMVGARGHSGVLTVNPANPLRLVIADGAVVAGGSSSPLALCRSLLARGLVGAEVVQELLGVADGSGDRRGERPDPAGLEVGEVLVRVSDLVGPDVVAPVVREQAVATLFEMLMLTAGDFSFTPASPHPLAAQFAVPCAQMVAEASAQVATWPDVVSPVGGEAMYLRRVKRITAAQAPVRFDALEWAALSEIEDRATVGQIAHRLGLGRYDGHLLLGGLISRGVIEHAG